MTREKYLELFRKFTKGEININGVVLIPQLWNIREELVFTINNPDKISYTETALTGYLQEIFLSFHKLIGFHFKSEYGEIDLYGDEMFISIDLFKSIENKLKSVSELKLHDIKLDVTHIRFEINLDGEAIEIINYVKPTYCEIKDVKDVYVETDVKYGVLGYSIMQKNSRFDEHEFNYMSIDDLIDNYPNFIDSSWQLYYVKTKFVD